MESCPNYLRYHGVLQKTKKQVYASECIDMKYLNVVLLKKETLYNATP